MRRKQHANCEMKKKHSFVCLKRVLFSPLSGSCIVKRKIVSLIRWPKTAIFHYGNRQMDRTVIRLPATCRQTAIIDPYTAVWIVEYPVEWRIRAECGVLLFNWSKQPSKGGEMGREKSEIKTQQDRLVVCQVHSLFPKQKKMISSRLTSVQRAQTETDRQFSTRTIWFISFVVFVSLFSLDKRHTLCAVHFFSFFLWICIRSRKSNFPRRARRRVCSVLLRSFFPISVVVVVAACRRSQT